MRTNIVALWIIFVGAYLLGGSPPEAEAQPPPLKQLLSERDPHEIANEADLDDLLGALEEAVPK